MMATKGKPDEELLTALEWLDDDLLDADFPKDTIDRELRAAGIDVLALGARGIAFIERTRESERLSWQTKAAERLAKLEAGAQLASVSSNLDRQAVLLKLEELRTRHADAGKAIRMAAHKRKPEESSDEELRGLLAEIEAVVAMELIDAEPENDSQS